MTSMIDTLEIRERISSDHALLRSLIESVIAAARTAERDQTQRPIIKEVLCRLCVELERYFRYEEEVIVPLLRDVDAWGPVRVERLCEEHEEQRSLLFALAEDAEEGARNVEDLADEIVCFFRRFEEHMVEKEKKLLEAEAIGAEPNVDMIDG